MVGEQLFIPSFVLQHLQVRVFANRERGFIRLEPMEAVMRTRGARLPSY
jgi:hypothetical protein